MFKTFREAFIAGMDDDKCRESSTRKLVRYVTGVDYVGDIDMARKFISEKLDVPEDVKVQVMYWMKGE